MFVPLRQNVLSGLGAPSGHETFVALVPFELLLLQLRETDSLVKMLSLFHSKQIPHI